MSSRITKITDLVADSLENEGLIKEAHDIDVVSNTIDSTTEEDEQREQNATMSQALEEIIPELDVNSRYTILDKIFTPFGRLSQNVHFKPKGLWYGCGSAWLNWILGEQPDWIKEYLYEVKVGAVLKISTFEKLMEFTQEYKSSNPRLSGIENSLYIDWIKVSQKYPGIEICPYIHEARRNDRTEWYYPWDVASGCVWDCSAIQADLVYKYQNGSFNKVGK